MTLTFVNNNDNNINITSKIYPCGNTKKFEIFFIHFKYYILYIYYSLYKNIRKKLYIIKLYYIHINLYSNKKIL